MGVWAAEAAAGAGGEGKVLMAVTEALTEG